MHKYVISWTLLSPDRALTLTKITSYTGNPLGTILLFFYAGQRSIVGSSLSIVVAEKPEIEV